MGDVMVNRRESPLNVLRQRNFLLYWLGQFLSLTGSWMQTLALSILIHRLDQRAFALGAVNFATALPPALLLLFAGAVADRRDKRHILLITQVVIMGVAFTLAALVRTGTATFWHVVTMGAILGTAQAFDLPANQALVPELVDRHEIPAAVQLNQAIFHGSRVIGPPIASVLVAATSLYFAFLANALSFIPVIGTLVVIRSLRPSDHRPAGRTLDQVREGFAFLRTRPHLMSILAISAVITLIIFPNMAVLTVYYVDNVLGGNDALLGVVMGFSGGGAFLGAMALLYVPARRRVAHIGLGLVGLCLGLLVMASAPMAGGWSLLGARGNVIVACISAALTGGAMASAMGMMATILQQHTPDALRGRVMSLHSLVFLGIAPFASLLMTSVVDRITMVRELVVSAVVAAILFAVLYELLATHMVTDAPEEPVAVEPLSR